MRRADAGVLGGEPFFRILHERHPDVDLVILPPTDSPDPDQSLASADEVRQTATAARSAFDRVLAAAGHPDPASRHESWRFDDSRVIRTFVSRATIWSLADHEAAISLLRDIGDALLAQGWDARAVVSSRAPELLASDGRHLLNAKVVVTSVTLRIESASIAASPETIDAVREGGR